MNDALMLKMGAGVLVRGVGYQEICIGKLPVAFKRWLAVFFEGEAVDFCLTSPLLIDRFVAVHNIL
jgi:hypothetical protein